MTTIPAAHSPSYTQEPQFEQAIEGEIAKFWHGRNQGFVRSHDKRKLHWVSFTATHHTKAIVVVNGRIECCEKYQELLFDLFQQGFDVYSYDHRGQGLSERLIAHSDVGYVEEFDDYVQDLAHMVQHFNLAHYQSRYLLAHSMGGNVATRYIQTTPNHPFTAMTVSAPMFGVNLKWYINPIAPWIGQLLTAIQSKGSYAPGQVAYYSKPFEGNLLSQSDVRYHWFRKLYQQQPELQVGGASARWVWQGLLACKQCLLLTRQIKIPMLILQAGDDKVVANQAQIKLIKKLAKTNVNCALKIIHHARHELFFEKDEYRNQAIDSTLKFFEQYQ